MMDFGLLTDEELAQEVSNRRGLATKKHLEYLEAQEVMNQAWIAYTDASFIARKAEYLLGIRRDNGATV